MKKLYSKLLTRRENMPLDLKIIGTLIEIISLFFFLLGLLFASDIWTTTQPETRPAVFGMLLLSSDISFSINFLTIGFFGFFSGFGISKGHKFGLWLLFILLADDVINGMIMFAEFKKTVIVTFAIEFILVIWLFYRRRFFNIGNKTKSEVP